MVETVKGLTEAEKYDVFTPGYGVRAFLYVMYGYMDGCTGTFLLWFFGALLNDPKAFSVYISMFTFWSSAAYIIAYALDYYFISKEFTFGKSWFVQAIGPIFLILIVMYLTKDTNIVLTEETVVEGSDQMPVPEKSVVKTETDMKTVETETQGRMAQHLPSDLIQCYSS